MRFDIASAGSAFGSIQAYAENGKAALAQLERLAPALLEL